MMNNNNSADDISIDDCSHKYIGVTSRASFSASAEEAAILVGNDIDSIDSSNTCIEEQVRLMNQSRNAPRYGIVYYDNNTNGSNNIFIRRIVYHFRLFHRNLQQPTDARRTNQCCRYGVIIVIVAIAIVVIIVIVAIAIVVTISLAVRSSSTVAITHQPTRNNHPTPIPTSAVVALSPMTLNEKLMVACNFLSFTTLSECQGAQAMGRSTVGSSIPSEIGLLTQITSLVLYSNQLTGTIPSTLGNLNQLIHLNLFNNVLTGTIPSTLGNLVKITYLNLNVNQLTGSIPSIFGNLVHLTDLRFYSNQLTSTIPTQLGNLVQLDHLSLSKNEFTGTFPSTLGNLVRLTNLNLYFNKHLGGSIPSSLCSIASNPSIQVDCKNIACRCCQSEDCGAMALCAPP